MASVVIVGHFVATIFCTHTNPNTHTHTDTHSNTMTASDCASRRLGALAPEINVESMGRRQRAGGLWLGSFCDWATGLYEGGRQVYTTGLLCMRNFLCTRPQVATPACHRCAALMLSVGRLVGWSVGGRGFGSCWFCEGYANVRNS